MLVILYEQVIKLLVVVLQVVLIKNVINPGHLHSSKCIHLSFETHCISTTLSRQRPSTAQAYFLKMGGH